VKLGDVRERRNRRNIEDVESMAGVESHAKLDRFRAGVSDQPELPREVGVAEIAAARRERVGVTAGMELARVKSCGATGFDLRDRRINERGREDPGGVKLGDDGLPSRKVAPDVQTAFGRDFLPSLGDERGFVGSEAIGERDHRFGAGHLEVEPNRHRPAEKFNVAVDDVAAVLAEVNRDALSPGADGFERGVEDIGLAVTRGAAGSLPISGLTQGGDMVNVDAEDGHAGA
jgi:hypothetical protein